MQTEKCCQANGNRKLLFKWWQDEKMYRKGWKIWHVKALEEQFFLSIVGNTNHSSFIIKISFSISSVPGTIISPYRNINYLQYIWKWFVQMKQISWDEPELLLPSLLNWKQQSIICLSYVWIYFCPSVYHGTYHPKNQSLSSKKLGDECCWILFL